MIRPYGLSKLGKLFIINWISGSVTASIFDPHVRLAGASGPAYALMSAHLANVILHHASMSRPFLRLTGLLLVASAEVGLGIYRRYAPPEPDKPQVSFAAHLAGVVAGLTFGLVILRNYEQQLSERRVWWISVAFLLGLCLAAFLYQGLFNNPAFTIFCTGSRSNCPPWLANFWYMKQKQRTELKKPYHNQ
jgi:membrane associated rhomboid family serine protease